MIWTPIEQELPVTGRIVLATYLNAGGKRRIIRAAWIAENAVEAGDDDEGVGVYNETDDTFYLPQGWWEHIDNWDDLAMVFVNEGEITHWMPLPEFP